MTLQKGRKKRQCFSLLGAKDNGRPALVLHLSNEPNELPALAVALPWRQYPKHCDSYYHY